MIRGIASAEGQGRKDEFHPPKNGWLRKKYITIHLETNFEE
jgi:hypothetical protein